jgi:HPt (histidine-containing phosphotransfer) domain-containing protein
LEAPAESPPLDLSTIDGLRALESPNRPTLVADVMRVYVDSSSELIDDLRASVEDRNAEGVSRGAHALKSSSANVGALPLAALCQELETMGREGNLAGAKDFFERLVLEHRRAIGALQSEGLIRG